MKLSQLLDDILVPSFELEIAIIYTQYYGRIVGKGRLIYLNSRKYKQIEKSAFVVQISISMMFKTT